MESEEQERTKDEGGLGMTLNHYEKKMEKLAEEVMRGDGINFVIDFTSLLRGKGLYVFSQLSKVLPSKCCWYIIPDFEKQIDMLLEEDSDSNNIYFNTDDMLDSLEASWDFFSKLPLHYGDNVPVAYEFFKKLSAQEMRCCLITGNETEAWRHILGKQKGDILLVTDMGTYYFKEEMFSGLIRDYGTMETPVYHHVADDETNKCRTEHNEIITYEDILSDNGAEGMLYSACQGKTAIKIYEGKMSNVKEQKLIELISFSDEKEHFAWPQEFVYHVNKKEDPRPMGFTMEVMDYYCSLNELFCRVTSEHNRWKVAASFMSSVLFLHLHGIQIGDYNFNNFYVTAKGDVVFFDMDSYVIGTMGTEVRGNQPISFQPDYTSRKDVIKADYVNLASMVFCILMDGEWPFYYNEDTGQSEYIFLNGRAGNEETQQAFDQMPLPLKKYFTGIFDVSDFEKQAIGDLFELYFCLLQCEPKRSATKTAVQKTEPTVEETKKKQGSLLGRWFGKFFG